MAQSCDGVNPRENHAFGSREHCPGFVPGSQNIELALGYSRARTLLRQLAEEGATFARLKDDVVVRFATNTLEQSDIPFAKVSALVG
jgi:hypothetical protein